MQMSREDTRDTLRLGALRNTADVEAVTTMTSKRKLAKAGRELSYLKTRQHENTQCKTDDAITATNK